MPHKTSIYFALLVISLIANLALLGLGSGRVRAVKSEAAFPGIERFSGGSGQNCFDASLGHNEVMRCLGIPGMTREVDTWSIY